MERLSASFQHEESVLIPMYMAGTRLSTIGIRMMRRRSRIIFWKYVNSYLSNHLSMASEFYKIICFWKSNYSFLSRNFMFMITSVNLAIERGDQKTVLQSTRSTLLNIGKKT